MAHGLDGEVKPLAPGASWEYERARYTIEILGFNSHSVPAYKREQWQSLYLLIELVGDVNEVKDQLQKHLAPEHEYSSFFRSAIGTHRNKAWIEGIL